MNLHIFVYTYIHVNKYFHVHIYITPTKALAKGTEFAASEPDGH